jgi:hypothetical protein
MKQTLYIFVFMCTLTILGCDAMTKKMCGEPEGKEKVFIDSLNVFYTNRLIIKQVPCYPGYIQANLQTDISKEILDTIEGSCRENQWIEFLVYDKDGKLIRGNTGSM